MKNFTENKVRQAGQSVVLDLQKVPLQAFLSVPAESVSAIYFALRHRQYDRKLLKVLETKWRKFHLRLCGRIES